MSEQEIYIEATSRRDPADRRRFLDEVCAGNEVLRERIETLIRQSDQLGSFLENSPQSLGATADISVAAEKPGTLIGPYKLLQQIGEGGMGVVYMAEQLEPIARRVALKIIKPGMDSRQVIARFEAERQALAMMDHVNIARVLDAGTTEAGRPYFVMELVHGVPITKYCDDNRLTPRQRLELFVPVCQAIQHAHQKGIIHRDIKPSNVMVTLYDGKPVPKVIDFGVAKATEQKLTERTLFTQYGTMVGTLEYMSPEQAEMSALGVDTRSDIYSLGVLLYELLTGSTPLSRQQMKDAAYGEILRLIREEEPPKPSTRLSDSGEALASISAQRHTEPAKLTKLVRGELDWIVMKTLEKDRNRRYETASGFAADVQRYLNDEQVQACPPSAAYRLRKFARRNKAALATTTIVAVALVLGTAVSTSQAIRATKAENLARGLLVSEKNATAKEAAARKEAEANLGKARQAVQQMLTRVGEERLAYIPQVEEVRRKLFEDALRFYEELLQQKDVDPAIRLEAALARLRVGNMARVLGRHSEGERHCRAAVTIMLGLCREQPECEQFQLVLSDAYQGLGEALATDNVAMRTTEAEQTLQSSIHLRSNLAVRSPKDPDHRQRQSVSYRWLALALARKPSRQQDAAAACKTAVEISQRLVSEFPSSPDYRAGLASAHYTLCTILDKLKQPAAAREHLQAAVTLFERLELASSDTPASLRRELGTTHQGLAAYRHDLASAYCRWGDWLAKDGNHQEAADAFRKGLAIYERLVADFPSVPLYRRNLAPKLTRWSTFLEASGDKVAAEAAIQRAIDLYKELAEQIPTDDRQARQRAYKDLIWTLLDVARRPEEAETICREEIALAEKSVAESGGATAELRLWSDLLYSMGRGLQNQLRSPEAAEVYRQHVDVVKRLVAAPQANFDDRYRLEEAYTTLGYALKFTGKNDEAIAAHRQALSLAEHLAAEFRQERKYLDRPAENHWLLADLLRKTGRLDDAVQHYEQVARFYEMHPERNGTQFVRGGALIGLAQTFALQGQSEKAAAAYEQFLKIKPDSAYDNYYLAWLLANCEEPKLRDPGRAVEFATRALELQPQDRIYLIALGAAQYRAGNWKAASAALKKSTELDQGGNAYTWFFLAMADWQLDQNEEARQCYDQAVEWMEKNSKDNADLRRFRTEAEELMKKESGVRDQESENAEKPK